MNKNFYFDTSLKRTSMIRVLRIGFKVGTILFMILYREKPPTL
jgi:hypothetical protein